MNTDKEKTLNIDKDLVLKIDNFIDSLADQKKAKLASKEAEYVIMQMRNKGVKLKDIVLFLKNEMGIQTTPQAISQKYSSLTKKRGKDAE